VVSTPKRRSDTSNCGHGAPYRLPAATMWSPAPASAANTANWGGQPARGGDRAEPTFEAGDALLNAATVGLPIRL